MFVTVGWLVSCTATTPAAGAGDSGGAAGTPGFLLTFDSGIPSCDRDATSVTSPVRDSGACVASRHVSFLGDVAPLLSQRCTGEICHEGTWGGPSAISYLVDVPATECCDGRMRVVPGSPGESYVVQKLRGDALCAGRPMPLSGTISAAEIQTISDWICEGAPP